MKIAKWLLMQSPFNHILNGVDGGEKLAKSAKLSKVFAGLKFRNI